MIGTVLRVRYELVQVLDEGPIFTTYVGRDRQANKDVAVRVLHEPYAGEKAFHSALKETIERSHRADHPSIERIAELDVHDGIAYMVGELTVGTRLDDRIRKLAPFSVPLAVTTAVDVCEALAALHRVGLVHGDIGAHTIVVRPDNSVCLQLTDFWEAYGASATAGSVVLQSMAPYLAPEVCAGAMPTPSSDVYAVGVLLYEMLTGRQPFQGETAIATAMKHAAAPIPNVATLNRSVPPTLVEIVRRSLAKAPEERYRDASELLSELRVFQDALRFGRSVTVNSPGASTKRTPLAGVEAEVAPRMSAIESEAVRRKGIDVSDTGIPGFLKGAIWFFSALIGGMVLAFVIFNVNKPQQVRVPDLRGLSVAEASDQLNRLHLNLRVGARETNEEVPRDHIVDLNPSANQPVFEGSTVTAKVSSGSRFVTVPDLRGYTVDDARALLKTVDLELDERVIKRRNDQYAAGTVFDQSPEPKRRLERLSRVSVTVSSPDEVSRVDTTTSYMHKIKLDLSSLDRPVVVRVDMTDARPTRVVYERRHEPGDTVEFEAEGIGEDATISIFYDNELVKTVPIKATRDGRE
ncbi:MAG: PASTA domain-containing protein [Fimbriimonadaceae bacterium]|nr:PASTA domain-containing protein [Fimbriimonadaceae bacterium]